MRRDLRLFIFSILPFPLGENTRGRISERSGNVEGPGALLTSKQIFFGGNAKVGASLVPRPLSSPPFYIRVTQWRKMAGGRVGSGLRD